MKKHVFTATRILLGLMLVGSAIAGMLGKAPPPETESAMAFMGVLVSSGLIYLVKIVELVCGLALLTGFFVPLALLVVAPVLVNIVFFHAALDPAGLGAGLVLSALWLATGIGNRALLMPLLRPKVVA